VAHLHPVFRCVCLPCVSLAFSFGNTMDALPPVPDVVLQLISEPHPLTGCVMRAGDWCQLPSTDHCDGCCTTLSGPCHRCRISANAARCCWPLREAGLERGVVLMQYVIHVDRQGSNCFQGFWGIASENTANPNFQQRNCFAKQ
jgi:hypothetical protein